MYIQYESDYCSYHQLSVNNTNNKYTLKYNTSRYIARFSRCESIENYIKKKII